MSSLSTKGSLDTSTVDLDDLNRTLNTVVLESYGTPESAGLLSANTEYDSKVGTLGKPVSGCEVCVFDPDTRVRLSPNMKGDIAVRGDTVPKAGYMNDDAFNEWAKIPDEDGGKFIFPQHRSHRKHFSIEDEASYFALVEIFCQTLQRRNYRGRYAFLSCMFHQLESQKRCLVSVSPSSFHRKIGDDQYGLSLPRFHHHARDVERWKPSGVHLFFSCLLR